MRLMLRLIKSCYYTATGFPCGHSLARYPECRDIQSSTHLQYVLRPNLDCSNILPVHAPSGSWIASLLRNPMWVRAKQPVDNANSIGEKYSEGQAQETGCNGHAAIPPRQFPGSIDERQRNQSSNHHHADDGTKAEDQ